jgi:tripartite-type tricarboxylate transporter receptor subunit TctC
MNTEQRYSPPALHTFITRGLLALVCGAMLSVSVSNAAVAADSTAAFPNRPVRIIVGFGPGGTADIIARLMAEQLSDLWKQPVIVENRPGASGAIGAELVAKSAKDGYTMGTVSGTFTIVPALGQKLPFDMQKDFTILNRIVEVPYLLVAGSGPNVKGAASVADFLNAARGKPKLVSYASSGPGSMEHLAAELLGAAAKVEFLHVPYKGSGAAIPDIMAGRVDFTFSAVPDLIGFVRNKTLRAVGVASAKRLPVLPDVPAFSETLPGFEIGQWFALAAPSGIPRPIVEKLNADLGKIATGDKLKPAWDERLITGTSHSLKAADEHFRAQLARWDKIVKALGLDKQAD